jgi:hypothetical protein
MPLPPSLELPQPVQDLRASRKGDVVHLIWTVPRQTTDRTAVRLRHLGPTRICRSLRVAMTTCAEQVGDVDTVKLVSAVEAAPSKAGKPGATAGKTAPVLATSQDRLPPQLQTQNPTGFINYAVETMNTRGRSAGLSNQVEVPLAPTLGPPSDLAAKVTADGIVLNWTGTLPEQEAPELQHVFRVYRQEQGAAGIAVGEVQPGTSEAQFVDHSFQWQKTYRYWLTVVTLVPRNGPGAQVEGDNSAPITVFAADVFPPAVPSGLQAVFSSVGQQPFVDLTWAPNTDPDLAGYNVYRHEENGTWARLNSALVPTPSYRDSDVAAGRTYFYAVTAVDVHGNESSRSQEASEAVPSTE